MSTVPAHPELHDSAGIVVIGRDLGDRLGRCLCSVRASGVAVVYVDSASSDGSADRARAAGVRVVALDASAPLSASRGRNEGVRDLRSAHPDVRFVQFVDGDCELDREWLGRAVAAMHANPKLGVVCGHLREKHADRSVVARMLDVDWRGPVGEIAACGGIFLCRLDAFDRAGEFAAGLVTGEEAHLCARIRGAGFLVVRLDAPMCTHDADMHRFGAWWGRTVRVGRTYAADAKARTGASGESAGRRTHSALAWGIGAPVFTLACALGGLWWRPLWIACVLVIAMHVAFAARVALRMRARGLPARDAAWYGVFTLLAKYAHAVGCVRFWARS